MVSSLVTAIAAITASALVGSARFITSAASSNRACTKPMGWVHGRFVVLVKATAKAAELSLVSDDLNGWFGVHQTSDDRLWPALPRASRACGNKIALPIDTIFGLKPCRCAWLQKVVKS